MVVLRATRSNVCITAINCTSTILRSTSSDEHQYKHSCTNTTFQKHIRSDCNQYHMEILPLKNIQVAFVDEKFSSTRFVTDALPNRNAGLFMDEKGIVAVDIVIDFRCVSRRTVRV